MVVYHYESLISLKDHNIPEDPTFLSSHNPSLLWWCGTTVVIYANGWWSYSNLEFWSQLYLLPENFKRVVKSGTLINKANTF